MFKKFSIVLSIMLSITLLASCTAADTKLMGDIYAEDIYSNGVQLVPGGGAGDVTAAANMVDNTLIRGDGGLKGIQDSGITIDDFDGIDTNGGDITGFDIWADNDVNVSNDLDVTDDAGIGGNLTVTGTINELTLTKQATGFTASGGTVSKTLTVTNNATIAGTPVLESLVDAKGDIITATADNTSARLAVGAVNGQVLIADSATATGLKWVEPPLRTLMTTANQTINAGAGTFVDITNLTFPVANGSNYAFKFYIVFQSATATTGYKASVNCPNGTLDFFCTSQTVANSATVGVATWLQRHSVTRDDMTTLTATVTINVDLVVIIEGRYLCTQAGTFAARFANELAANNDITVRTGSWGTYFVSGAGAK